MKLSSTNHIATDSDLVIKLQKEIAVLEHIKDMLSIEKTNLLTEVIDLQRELAQERKQNRKVENINKVSTQNIWDNENIVQEYKSEYAPNPDPTKWYISDVTFNGKPVDQEKTYSLIDSGNIHNVFNMYDDNYTFNLNLKPFESDLNTEDKWYTTREKYKNIF